MEERLDGRCVVGRHSGRWAIVVGERSAERAAASSLRTAVVAEEVAGIRRIVVAGEGHHILRTEADRSLAVEGDTAAEEDILRTVAAEAAVALGRSLPGYGVLGRDSTTCLREKIEVKSRIDKRCDR